MRSLVFDSGPLISLTTTNLLWLLEPLKQKFKGEFFIAEDVKKEIVDTPLVIKRFKFEALQIQQLIDSSILTIYETGEVKELSNKLLNLANRCYVADNNYIRIVHPGEMESLAAALKLGSDALVIDERTTRMLIENPEGLRQLLEKRLHAKIFMNKNNADEFVAMTKNVKLIRSIELVTVAFERGLLDKFVVGIKNPRKELLDSVLWGVKLHGCAVSSREIDEIVGLESK